MTDIGTEATTRYPDVKRQKHYILYISSSLNTTSCLKACVQAVDKAANSKQSLLLSCPVEQHVLNKILAPFSY